MGRRLRDLTDAVGVELWAAVERVPLAVLFLAPAVILAVVVSLLPEPLIRGLGTDIELYHRYASRILSGEIPYRDVPIEYPPLALVPMLAPTLGAAPGSAGFPNLSEYTSRFVLVAAALSVVPGWLLWQFGGRSRRAIAVWGALAVLMWVAAALRYDLWPAIATIAGVLVAAARPGLAGILLGGGTMLKLYPAVVAPILAAAVLVGRDGRGLVRLGLGFLVVVGLVGAWAWAVAGPDSLGWLRYQGDRGLQLESVGASVLLGLHVLIGLPVERNFMFGAAQIVAPGSAEIVATSPWFEAALLVGVLGISLRRFRLDQRDAGRVAPESIHLAALAAITVSLIASKVLSMQYILWLLPFVPLLHSRIGWLGMALAALTTAIFTFDYEGLAQFEPGMVALLLARNGLLIVLGLVLVRSLWSGR
jgi:hypothetical protein